MAKPLIAIAPNWGVVGGLRVSDRVGKAVRGVPRDVIISDVTEPEHRGRAFGFHRAMDSAGAMVGPLVGIGVLLLIGQQNLRPVFLVALIPGLASVWLLTGLPRTDKPAGEEKWEPAPLPWRGKFGWFVAATALFSIGNSSDAFLLLRAKNLGLSTIQVILAYAAFNLVYAVVSLPAGIKSDKSGRFRVYSFGLIAFAVVYAGFGLARSAMLVWPLIAFYGIYMALTDGIGRALVVDLVPQSARGKALGVTQAITGGGVLIAGVLAGILWDQVSPSTPFLVGAVTAVLGAVMLVTTVGAGRTS